MQKKTFRLIILALTMLASTACTLGTSAQGSSTLSIDQMVLTMSPPTATEAPQPTATQALPTATATEAQTEVTSTPAEEVATATATLEATPTTSPAQTVQNFLQSYGGDPATVATFLSAALQAQYPGDKVNTMLPISGTIKGVALQSESIVPDPPSAEELIALRNENTSYLLVFDLIVENGVWVIDKVFGL
ncbi:MAG TPA: hypothetical protein VMC62_02935 [Longilinea sp.]|nr:hypothetical protein [Longilinea sp.]